MLERARGRTFAIVLVAAFFAFAIYAAVRPHHASTPTTTPETTVSAARPTPTAAAAQLRYVVTVAAGNQVSVTYHNAEGGTEQVDYTGAWDKVLTVPSGYVASLVAQLKTSYATAISCDLQVNGQTVKHSESRAQFGIVTCSGTVD